MKFVYITMSYISGALVHVYWFEDFVSAITRAQLYTNGGLLLGDDVLCADRTEVFKVEGMNLEEFETALDGVIDELGLDPFDQEYYNWLLGYAKEELNGASPVACTYRV